MNGGRKGRGDADTFTLDGAYLREQAREAVKLFLAPLSGVYHAITDRPAGMDKRA